MHNRSIDQAYPSEKLSLCARAMARVHGVVQQLRGGALSPRNDPSD
jgi:hypothetical protein